MTDAAATASGKAKPVPRWLRALKALRHRKMLAMLLLSLAAGIPYGAVLGTLNAWLTAEGVTPSQIGILNFIILAYSFKLIWAPGFQKAWFPRIGIPFLKNFGPRRSWLLVMQLIVACLLGLLAHREHRHPGGLAGAVRQADRAAHHLVGLTRVDAQADRHLHGGVLLLRGRLLGQLGGLQR